MKSEFVFKKGIVGVHKKLLQMNPYLVAKNIYAYLDLNFLFLHFLRNLFFSTNEAFENVSMKKYSFN